MAARRKIFTLQEIIACFKGDISSSEGDIEEEETFF
jgi:hypothetical protein